jgi:hypothetical protein
LIVGHLASLHQRIRTQYITHLASAIDILLLLLLPLLAPLPQLSLLLRPLPPLLPLPMLPMPFGLPLAARALKVWT